MGARARRLVRTLATSAALAAGLAAVAVAGAGSAAAAEPNGCGPSSWKVDIVPDGFGRADFRPTCDDHDVCYGAGSSVARAASARLSRGCSVTAASRSRARSTVRVEAVGVVVMRGSVTGAGHADRACA